MTPTNTDLTNLDDHVNGVGHTVGANDVGLDDAGRGPLVAHLAGDQGDLWV